MKKIKLLIMSVLLSCSLVVGCSNHIDSDASISEHGIQVRSLTSGIDGEGHDYKTYSFVVVPSSSTATVSSSISFADSRTNGASYLTSSVDNSLKEFTITCLQAFDSQATVRLSASLGSAYAEITVDYRQKLAGIDWSDSFVVDGAAAQSFSWSSFSSENVSAVGGDIYTISQSFTYLGLESQTGGFITFPDCVKTPANDDLHDLQMAFQNVISSWLSFNVFGQSAEQGEDDLYTYIKSALSSLTSSTKEDLATGIIDNSIRMQFNFNSLSHRVNCSIDGVKNVTTDPMFATFLLPASVYQNYGVSVPLTAINPETSSIEF